jgi:hypothetical protein
MQSKNQYKPTKSFCNVCIKINAYVGKCAVGFAKSVRNPRFSGGEAKDV